ncbi:MAG: hypothetical protein GF388_07765, partial [Candidatus Aegiribacteria sp.]|nr:hypothetical protein [Candidatus Aegiribacteria sp.]
MDTTSVTVTAGMVSPYNDITASDTGLDWSWTNCPEEAEYKDTWHGVFDDLSSLSGGRITLSIQASDHDANGLMDPSIPCSDGTDYNDTHHSFSLMGVQTGWPVTLSEICYGAPTVADLDDDGDLDVSLICDDGYVYLLDDDGSSLVPGVWPELISSWNCYTAPLKSAPALADLDEDGNLDLIAFLTPGCGAEAVADSSNIPGWPVYPGDPEDSLLTAEYPGQTSPTLGDLDGDGNLELLFTRHLADSSTILQHTICMYEHTGGNETWSRNLQYSTNGASVISTPAVADFDGDGACEVVVCTAEGFNVNTDEYSKDLRFGQSAVYLLDGSDGSTIWKTDFSAWFQASPVVADVDKDGTLEIIVGTDFAAGPYDRRKIFVLNGSTGMVEYEEEYDYGGVYYAAALGHLDSDPYIDFVVPCSNDTVFAYSGADYSKLFSVYIGEDPGSPILVDVDGDMELEIVFGTSSGNLWALNTDGTTCSGYPIAVGGDIRACPAAGDIDGDGHLEIVMVDADNPAVYCLDLGAGTYPTLMPWRQFQHDSWHSGCFDADNTIPAAPTNLDGEVEYNVFGGTTTLTWDLSVNDFYSSSPVEPKDVTFYEVFRYYVGSGISREQVIARTHAGENTVTDNWEKIDQFLVYRVTANDGTNRSDYSNEAVFPTSTALLLSIGCSAVEVSSGSRSLSPSVSEVSRASDPPVEDVASQSTAVIDTPAPVEGNPLCLTDGIHTECYKPSADADAVVIDLGGECCISGIIPETASGFIQTLDTERVVQLAPPYRIAVAGSDREYSVWDGSHLDSVENIRYVKVTGAEGLSEISVYGSRESSRGDSVQQVEISSNDSSAGWMFVLPVTESGEEASIRIYDAVGRLMWNCTSRQGGAFYWDGCSEGTPVPSGVYLLQCSIGSEVTTGSFVVRRDR